VDNRQKNAKAAKQQQQARAQAKKAEKTLAQISDTDLDQQIADLTKRNNEYVFRLRKALTEGGMSQDKQVSVLKELVPQIMAAQVKGQPANQLFGPPLAKANSLINAPKPAKKVPMWAKMVDSMGLFAVFMFAFGALSLFTSKPSQKGQLQSFGLLSLLLIAIVAGAGLSLIQEMMAQPKGKRRPWWQIVLIGIVVFLAMLAMVSLGVFIPRVINPVLSGPVYAIIAALIYGGRWYFRKQFGITGNVFGPATPPKKKA
jgi:uncharacterized membrane-anchored protein